MDGGFTCVTYILYISDWVIVFIIHTFLQDFETSDHTATFPCKTRINIARVYQVFTVPSNTDLIGPPLEIKAEGSMFKHRHILIILLIRRIDIQHVDHPIFLSQQIQLKDVPPCSE